MVYSTKMLIIAKYICGNTFQVNSVFNGLFIKNIETSKTYYFVRGAFCLIKTNEWNVCGEKLILKSEKVSKI